MKPLIFLYGPPGSGKTETGLRLASALDLPFVDLDTEITDQAGQSIPDIFVQEGEAGFRARERAALEKFLILDAGVIALGGGALLDQVSRADAETRGRVICLQASPEVLLARLKLTEGSRPLLSGRSDPDLLAWLSRRQAHYDTFPSRLDASELSPDQTAWQCQIRLGIYHVIGMGQSYDVVVSPGELTSLGEELHQRGLKGPVAVVSDERVGSIYSSKVAAALRVKLGKVVEVTIPGGERAKTLDTVTLLWEAFVNARLERGSTVVALGGGVVTDLTGFAAATFMRGVAWVVVPTSLLGMVDASLGGKTGADLPQGKNLIGAFHPPRLVWADPRLLESLPEAELRNGLAEVVKHGVIGDPDLFERCSHGLEALRADWDELVRRAIAVKVGVIQADPYERGIRATLNLGHTVGHALEKVTGYQIPHGESVAIGMVAEAYAAVKLGLADADLPDVLAQTLSGLGLPTAFPDDLDLDALQGAMAVDKKRSGGVVKFALPVRIGEVRPGIAVDNLNRILKEFNETHSRPSRSQS